MHTVNLFTADFGTSKANATGSNGVGYQILDSTGSIVLGRTTTGVVQTAPGIYSVRPKFPDSDNSFQIVWDTGAAFPKTYYATETVNNLQQFFQLTASIAAVNQAVEAASDVIDATLGSIQTMMIDISVIRDFTAGRWKMQNNQMVFYKEDNVTEIARYQLLNDSGNPSMESVFERRKVVS
jgi:hypothetical protein